ncbi:MAG: hypothetical protein ACRC6K_02080 [Fusobacteriaceae bacterium]
MKKALVLFGNGENIENIEKIIESCKYLKEQFNFSISGLFLSDIRAEAILGQGIDGMILDSTRSTLTEDWIYFEQEGMDNIKKKLKENNLQMEMIHEIGITRETINEYMKSSDLLILGKTTLTSDILIEVLKENYKSIIILGNEKLDFSNLYIANDDGIKVNRSCYSFMNIFPNFNNFNSFSLVSEEKINILNKYLNEKDKNVNEIKIKTKEELIEKLAEKTGLLIMGNLSRSYFFKKITRKTGLKLLEKVNMSIYIG